MVRVRDLKKRPSKKPSSSANVFKYLAYKRLCYLVNILEYIGTIPNQQIFKRTLPWMPESDKLRILKSLFNRYDKDVFEYERKGFAKNERSVDDCLEGVSDNASVRSLLLPPVMRCLRETKKTIEASGCLGDPLKQRISQFAQMFRLDDVEEQLATFAHFYTVDRWVERLYDEFSDWLEIWASREQKLRMEKMAIILGVEKSCVSRALRKNGRLFKLGIFVEKNVPDEIVEFFEGRSATPLSERYFREFTGSVLPLASYPSGEEHFPVIKTLWKHKPAEKAVNILLYGKPGTGKTSFARTLAKELGIRVYEIKTKVEESGESDAGGYFRYRALLAFEQMVDLTTSCIIIDEADAMLNAEPEFFSSGGADKATVNTILDNSKAFIVWITNRFDGIAESSMRRFDYSIEFKGLTFEQRAAVWRTAAEKYGLLPYVKEADIERFASAYETSAGIIDTALRDAGRVQWAKGEAVACTAFIEKILSSHHAMASGRDCAPDIKKADTPEYGLEGLSVNCDIPQMMNILEEFNQAWAAGFKDSPVFNMNVLLYGPPGTGKTELAKYVARRLNRKLEVRPASDMLNKYVGETEKAIRAAFREAENERAILLIDEADSFFYNRESATHSWEISQVNEILTAMETFHGMLICATNLKTIMDSAAIRRFSFKIEFGYLKPEGVDIFYRRFCSRLSNGALSGADRARLRALEYLTPGDFKAVYKQYCFFGKDKVSHGMLVDALVKEVATKNGIHARPMGFSPASGS